MKSERTELIKKCGIYVSENVVLTHFDISLTACGGFHDEPQLITRLQHDRVSRYSEREIISQPSRFQPHPPNLLIIL